MWNIRGYEISFGSVHFRILLETSTTSICFWLNGIVTDKGKSSTTPIGFLVWSFSVSLFLCRLLPIPAFSDFTTRTQCLKLRKKVFGKIQIWCHLKSKYFIEYFINLMFSLHVTLMILVLCQKHLNTCRTNRSPEHDMYLPFLHLFT